MADAVDFATDLVADKLDQQIRVARAPIATGEPGECDECGEDMPRLVEGRCGFCRDGRRPPLSWYEARDEQAKAA